MRRAREAYKYGRLIRSSSLDFLDLDRGMDCFPSRPITNSENWIKHELSYDALRFIFPGTSCAILPYLGRSSKVYFNTEEKNDAIIQHETRLLVNVKTSYSPRVQDWSTVHQKLSKPVQKSKNCDQRLSFIWKNVYMVKNYFTFGFRTVKPDEVHVFQTSENPILIYKWRQAEKAVNLKQRTFKYDTFLNFRCYVMKPHSLYYLGSGTSYILMTCQKSVFAVDVVTSDVFKHLKDRYSIQKVSERWITSVGEKKTKLPNFDVPPATPAMDQIHDMYLEDADTYIPVAETFFEERVKKTKKRKKETPKDDFAVPFIPPLKKKAPVVPEKLLEPEPQQTYVPESQPTYMPEPEPQQTYVPESQPTYMPEPEPLQTYVPESQPTYMPEPEPLQTYVPDMFVPPQQTYVPDMYVPPQQTYVPDMFVPPQQTYVPDMFVPPQQTYVPDMFVPPQQTYVPDMFVPPQQTFIQEQNVPPQQTFIQEQNVPPQQTFIQEQNVPPQQTIIQEQNVPQQTFIQEQNVPPQQTIIQEQNVPPQQTIIQEQNVPNNLIDIDSIPDWVLSHQELPSNIPSDEVLLEAIKDWMLEPNFQTTMSNFVEKSLQKNDNIEFETPDFFDLFD